MSEIYICSVCNEEMDEDDERHAAMYTEDICCGPCAETYGCACMCYPPPEGMKYVRGDTYERRIHDAQYVEHNDVQGFFQKDEVVLTGTETIIVPCDDDIRDRNVSIEKDGYLVVTEMMRNKESRSWEDYG